MQFLLNYLNGLIWLLPMKKPLLEDLKELIDVAVHFHHMCPNKQCADGSIFWSYRKTKNIEHKCKSCTTCFGSGNNLTTYIINWRQLKELSYNGTREKINLNWKNALRKSFRWILLYFCIEEKQQNLCKSLNSKNFFKFCESYSILYKYQTKEFGVCQNIGISSTEKVLRKENFWVFS